mmetsp:Transcript_11490/g.25758  ORF Transcript_11490/g.25758 Transcript_11490/m.25758 type:complete len:503 (+) Transcript_11490:95-1603(+)
MEGGGNAASPPAPTKRGRSESASSTSMAMAMPMSMPISMPGAAPAAVAASPPSMTASSTKRVRTSPPPSTARAGTPSGTVETPTKANKGLRHFSMRVCKKVEEKGTTSYNEVADELVTEFIEQRRAEIIAAGGDPNVELPPTPKTKKSGKKTAGRDKGYDEKNIRRRVYDALNVLMAMDIISKEKKQITWKGLPSTAHHDLDVLQRERRARLEEIRRKQECLQELLVQNVCFSNLVKRNKERKMAEEEAEEEEEEGKAATTGAAAPDGTMDDDAEPNDANNAKEGEDKVDSSSKEAGRDPPPKAGDATAGWGSSSSADGSGTGGSNFPVPLPFIVVNTSSQAVIKCDMNPDRTDVMFDFSLPFEINDDNEILKRLQLDKTTMEDASRLFPRDLFTYAQEHRLLDHVLVSPDQMPDFHPAPLVTSAPAAVPSADPSVAPLLDDAAEPLAYDVASSSAAGAGVSTDNQARNAYYPPRNSSGAYAMPPSERHIAASDDVPTARSD